MEEERAHQKMTCKLIGRTLCLSHWRTSRPSSSQRNQLVTAGATWRSSRPRGELWCGAGFPSLTDTWSLFCVLGRALNIWIFCLLSLELGEKKLITQNESNLRVIICKLLRQKGCLADAVRGLTSADQPATGLCAPTSSRHSLCLQRRQRRQQQRGINPRRCTPHLLHTLRLQVNAHFVISIITVCGLWNQSKNSQGSQRQEVDRIV